MDSFSALLCSSSSSLLTRSSSCWVWSSSCCRCVSSSSSCSRMRLSAALSAIPILAEHEDSSSVTSREIARILQVGEFDHAVDGAVVHRGGDHHRPRLHAAQGGADAEIAVGQRPQHARLAFQGGLAGQRAPERQLLRRVAGQRSRAEAHHLVVLPQVEDPRRAGREVHTGGEHVARDVGGTLDTADTRRHQGPAALEPVETLDLLAGQHEAGPHQRNHPEHDDADDPVGIGNVGVQPGRRHEIAGNHQERTDGGCGDRGGRRAAEEAQGDRDDIECPFGIAHRCQEVGDEHQPDQQGGERQEQVVLLRGHGIRWLVDHQVGGLLPARFSGRARILESAAVGHWRAASDRMAVEEEAQARHPGGRGGPAGQHVGWIVHAKIDPRDPHQQHEEDAARHGGQPGRGGPQQDQQRDGQRGALHRVAARKAEGRLRGDGGPQIRPDPLEIVLGEVVQERGAAGGEHPEQRVEAAAAGEQGQTDDDIDEADGPARTDLRSEQHELVEHRTRVLLHEAQDRLVESERLVSTMCSASSPNRNSGTSTQTNNASNLRAPRLEPDGKRGDGGGRLQGHGRWRSLLCCRRDE